MSLFHPSNYTNTGSGSGSGGGIAPPQTKVMNLTAESQAQKAQQQALMQQMEVQKAMAFSATTTSTTGGSGSAAANANANAGITVPTLPADVRAALRQLGQPVRLFGENLADVRQRLRLELATRQVLLLAGGAGAVDRAFLQHQQEEDEEEEQVTKYTRAIPELLQARQAITVFSLQRAAARLARERQQRASAGMLQKRKRETTKTTAAATAVKTDPDENQNDTNNNNSNNSTTDDTVATNLDETCRQTYKSCRKLCLAASQFGDVRSLSAICAAQENHNNNDVIVVVATASWTGSIHLWNGSTAAMTSLGSKAACHLDRIMWMDVMTNGSNKNSSSCSTDSVMLLATASIDMTAKLWKVQNEADVVMQEESLEQQDADKPEDTQASPAASSYSITEMVHFKGHAARLCRTAFHPMQRHLGTTSFDHTWRLWDIETGQDLLLQDGHAKEVFGMAFHPDGSLCCTTDFASVVQLWDLRTGKSIQHYADAVVGGHAKRVTCADFSPNGIHLATAGDDGTIKIWDLRKRPSSSNTGTGAAAALSAAAGRVAKNALVANIPAHSQLVTRVKFERNGGGEYLVSSSFDGLAKVWSARDWKLIKELQGHDGQVSCVDILPRCELSSTSSSSSTRSGSVGIVTCGFDKTLKLWK